MLVAARSYRERVLEGFELLGERELFESSTLPVPPIADLQLIYEGEPSSPRSLRAEE